MLVFFFSYKTSGPKAHQLRKYEKVTVYDDVSHTLTLNLPFTAAVKRSFFYDFFLNMHTIFCKIFLAFFPLCVKRVLCFVTAYARYKIG